MNSKAVLTPDEANAADSDESRQEAEGKTDNAIPIFFLFFVAFIIAAPGILQVVTPSKQKAQREQVKEAVLASLRAPSTAEFVRFAIYDDKFFVDVDAQNGFGAQIRTTVTGSLKQTCERVSKRFCWDASIDGSYPTNLNFDRY